VVARRGLHSPGPSTKPPSPATAPKRHIIPDGAATPAGEARAFGPGQSSSRSENFGLGFIGVMKASEGNQMGESG
jgi:hypothetical protein